MRKDTPFSGSGVVDLIPFLSVSLFSLFALARVVGLNDNVSI